MIWHRMGRTNYQNVYTLVLVAAVVAGSATGAAGALIDLTPTNGVNSTNSVNLADLVSGAQMGIIVGDKIFTGFNYSRTNDMPAPENVNVLGFRDPAGNWGVTFQGAFLDVPGGGGSDASIRFIVDIAEDALEQGWRISDAHLYLNGVGVGQNSSFAVDESFALSGIHETLNTIKSTFGQGTSVLSDWTFFNPPLTRLYVTKDILALAGANADQPARATVIDQSFSQIQIPEPGAFVLGISVLACGALGFRNRRRR